MSRGENNLPAAVRLRFWRRLPGALVLAASASLFAGEPVMLTKSGVACQVGGAGVYTLGIPAIDGRGTHSAVIPSSIKTDGATLTAKFGPPFAGVTLRMRLLGGGRVEYVYALLPKDARLVMCQFDIPAAAITPGVTATFDSGPPVAIPVTPDKAGKKARLAEANARTLVIRWPSGEALTLTGPAACWHGVQDARIWGKGFVGVCLTPPLRRDGDDAARSTFVMTFGIDRAAIHPGAGGN